MSTPTSRPGLLYGLALGLTLRDLAEWAANRLGDHLKNRSTTR